MGSQNPVPSVSVDDAFAAVKQDETSLGLAASSDKSAQDALVAAQAKVTQADADLLTSQKQYVADVKVLIQSLQDSIAGLPQ